MHTDIAMPIRDPEGYLVDPDEWNEQVAEAIASEIGITLTNDHREAIRFMRRYYEDRRIAADARFVIKHLETLYPAEGRKRLFELFPYGCVGQACKVAGMKRPRPRGACSNSSRKPPVSAGRLMLPPSWSCGRR